MKCRHQKRSSTFQQCCSVLAHIVNITEEFYLPNLLPRVRKLQMNNRCQNQGLYKLFPSKFLSNNHFIFDSKFIALNLVRGSTCLHPQKYLLPTIQYIKCMRDTILANLNVNAQNLLLEDRPALGKPQRRSIMFSQKSII